MPAIITNKFRRHNAEKFSTALTGSSNVFYLGIGRPQAYATSTRPDGRTENEGTDVAPLTPADSIQEEFYSFDDLIAAKKLSTSDISFVIPRRNWTTGTTYDYYRHDYGNRITGTTTTQTADSGASSLFDSTFYVLNSENRVYKCLDNNGGAASTSEPTGDSNNIITTGDDYKWKFMYELSATQQVNFLSTDFMAVATNTTVAGANADGEINIVKIKTPGSGGTNGTHTNIDIRGDGSGGKVSVTVASGVVTAVTVTTPGTGYTYAYIRVADIVAAGATNLSGTELDCIIEPKGGHGENAVTELGGFFVMLNVNFEGSESSNTGDFTTANDFRRLVLLKDPNNFGGGSAASAATLRATKAVRFASSPTPGTFQVDEEINQATTGAVGKVVEYDSTNRILYYIQTRFNDEGADSNGNLTAFSGANVITGQTSNATGTPSSTSSETANNVTFSSGYANPEIEADDGDVIYIENRAPITRATDQTENVKLVIEF
tara:strand:- start:712 stop:2184 length:1473 start_codon:yes stop_codon:yes gene_type:complete